MVLVTRPLRRRGGRDNDFAPAEEASVQRQRTRTYKNQRECDSAQEDRYQLGIDQGGGRREHPRTYGTERDHRRQHGQGGSKESNQQTGAGEE